MVSCDSPDEGCEWNRGRQGETAVSAKLREFEKSRYSDLFVRIAEDSVRSPSDEIWGTWSERPLKMKPAIGPVVGWFVRQGFGRRGAVRSLERDDALTLFWCRKRQPAGVVPGLVGRDV